MFKVVTHSQQFHIDELMAIALLEHFVFKDKDGKDVKYELIRTRDNQIISKAQSEAESFVVDVGYQYNPEMLNFDHHQNDDNLCWPDGTPFSSCGMVWNWLRTSKKLHQHMNTETMDIIEHDLIRKIDMHDNGKAKWNEGIFLIMYNRKPDDPRAQDAQFKRALRAARDYYVNFFTYVRGNMQAEKDIQKAIKKSEGIKDVVVCDSNIKDAAERVAELTDKRMVIYPHSNGAWAIKTVPAELKNTFSMKCPAPKEWRGLKEKDLENASGIPGMFFCHKSGFVTMYKGSLDDAIKVAKVIMLHNDGFIQ